MLCVFRVTNYRSFRDLAELNLLRSASDSVDGFIEPALAPAVAIFGPNAAGKSNLLRAINTMFSMITVSTMHQRRLPYTPFALGRASNAPTTFQVVVRFDGVRYDYSFSYNAERVLSESLLSWPKGRQRVLFERSDDHEDGWYFGDSLSGPNHALARATRDDALFLSTAALLQHEFLADLQAKFAGLVRNLSAENMGRTLQDTLESLAANPERAEQVTHLLTRAELGIVSMTIEEDPRAAERAETARQILRALRPDASKEELLEAERAQLQPLLAHASADGSVPLPFAWESVGTRNFLALLGPVLDRLVTGGVLIVDEIDTSLHPRLVSELVRLFQQPHINRNQAQLLLSTHDVTVMMNTGIYNVLQRDQLWFVEKQPDGASELVPLTDFAPRKGEVFSRNYLLGRYGAIPEIDDTTWSIW